MVECFFAGFPGVKGKALPLTKKRWLWGCVIGDILVKSTCVVSIVDTLSLSKR